MIHIYHAYGTLLLLIWYYASGTHLLPIRYASAKHLLLIWYALRVSYTHFGHICYASAAQLVSIWYACGLADLGRLALPSRSGPALNFHGLQDQVKFC